MNRLKLLSILAVVAALAAIVIAPHVATACPFCNAAMQTLSQEIESADVSLIAELAEPMPTSADELTTGEELAAAKFRVIEVLRGEDRLAGAKEISVVYFGDEPPKKKFLINGLAGVTGPGLDWTTPMPLSDLAVDYVKRLLTLPPQGSERLEFFQSYLENDDPLLAQDAYDEFARTPYADVIQLAPKMDRAQLLRWIQDPSVGPSSRRLYLTMLGVCGMPNDVVLLEQLMNYDYLTMKPAIAAAMTVALSASPLPPVGVGVLDEILHSEERRKRESLDALIACYLKLKGPAGLQLINTLFLGNPKVEYKHLHSAIMALRFHGEETDVLPREALLDSMRLALNHRDFADQVIPDLTRWEDWEIMPRLIAMFKDSEKDDWIRPPVVSYLLVAADVPGEVGAQAGAAIEELETMDPEAVKQARKLSAFSMLARAAAPPATDAGEAAEPATGGDAAQNGASGAAETEASAEPEDPPVAAIAPVEPSGADAQLAAAATTPAAAAPKQAVVAATPTPPSSIKIIAIPLIAAAVLLGVFAVLLRGADPRSSNDNQ